MKSSLKKVVIENFICFENHTILMNEITIMIGENNAGKSTIVEALRILGLSCSRFKTATHFETRPTWINNVPLSTKGIHINSKVIDIDLEQIFYRYNDPPAKICALFENNVSFKIYINSESEIFGFLYFNDVNITSKTQTGEIEIPNISVLPQITPLLKNEAYVTKETLERNKFSRRTSGNFRSKLYLERNSRIFRKFEEIVSDTWSGIKVDELQIIENSAPPIMSMLLRDRDFVAEIYHMGHGVQMWLQTMWFIASTNENATVVLDEPDVYMHADLQRKLIRLLKGRFAQTIIATHSVEIMTEVQPDEILIINRKEQRSLYADGYPLLQAVITHMGSTHNINLARLLNNKTYLYVEGKDMEILKILCDKVMPKEYEPLDYLNSISTGGWGSWDAQKIGARKLKEAMEDIMVFFIYDRDYHTSDEISERYEDAARNKIGLHIWDYKEIENYLLVPAAIARFLKRKNPTLILNSLIMNISALIQTICEDLREETYYNILSFKSRLKFYRGYETGTVANIVKNEFDQKWSDPKYRLQSVSGKTLISRLSDKCKAEYNISFGDKQIAASLTQPEIPYEIKQVLNEIRGRRYGE